MKKECGCNHTREFRVLDIVFAGFIGLVVIVFARDIESSMFPVLDDFKVISVDALPDAVEISGTVNKKRQCDIISMTAYASVDGQHPPEIVNVTYQDQFPTTLKAAIPQQWGPWTLSIPYEYLEADIDLYSTHACHTLYNVTNHIASFKVNNDEDILHITSRD